MKKVSGELRAEAKAQGKGRMGQYGAQLAAHEVLAQTYAAMNPASILVNDPDNFAIDRATVTKV